MDAHGLVRQFAHHVQHNPDRDAVVFVSAAGDRSTSYAELDRAARVTAGWLTGRLQTGDRVLLLYPNGIEFVRSLLGCWYAGMVPVPAPLVNDTPHHLSRATGIALDADARAVLTDAANAATASAWMRQDGLDHLICFATDTLDPAEAVTSADVTDPAPEGLALLQYASGLPGDPRGVMVTHANLLHNLRVIQRTFDLTAADRCGGWSPLFQGFSLIALLLEPLLLGGTAVLMTPDDFRDRPQRWLELIDRQDLQFTIAPSFAYDLCARLTTADTGPLDLSRWRHACHYGVEPIDARAIQRFAERFTPDGFRSDAARVAYCVAESTLLVSGTGPGVPPTVRTVDAESLARRRIVPALRNLPTRLLVGSGAPVDQEVRIVDPANTTTVPDNHLGEVWIRGGSVTSGYWRREAETTAAFGDGFLRTGDLGVRCDGELFIIGVLREMLALQGRELSPIEVERAVRLLDPAFADLAGSAFAVAAPHQEIVVVHELHGDPVTDDLAALADRVKQALGKHLHVRVSNVVFVRPGGVRTTETGRIERSLMRQLFLADALDPVYEILGAETRRRYRPTAVA